MAAANRKTAEEIFATAVLLPSSQRASYLARACGGDSELLRQAEQLLAQSEDAQPTVAMKLADREWIGPYQIAGRLGTGGMGEVYRAHDPRLRRDVAIKVLPEAQAGDAQLRGRLLREARAVAALDHPNIVTVFDIGSEHGADYLVMEYVKGKTLKDVLAAGPLPFGDLIRYGIEIARTLGVAHTAGILHRDIKPANVMITQGSKVKILDFGLAKLQFPTAGQQESDLSVPGMIMGTVSYMSPEQARGEVLDGRSDIFSLGVLLYEAATGRLPFEGVNPISILQNIVNTEPAPPSSIQPALPIEFDRVLARALAKKKEERYPDADLFADALREIPVAGAVSAANQILDIPAPTHRSASQRNAEAVHVDVLFLDIVRSTRENSDVQHENTNQLTEILQNTFEFRRARAEQALISLPTGDGAALVFLRSSEAPLRCAIEIAHALKAQSRFTVRMGIHSGLVYRGPDVNGMPNVTGDGINLAQRVMDCGKGGHILLSASAATALRSITQWKDKIVYVGEYRSKEDKVSAWSYVDGDIGSVAPLAAERWDTSRTRRRAITAVAAVAALATGGFSVWKSRFWIPERSFRYSLLAQNGDGSLRNVAPGSMLHANDRLKLKFSSSQGGFLYVFSVSNANGASSCYWLFPEPAYHDASAEVGTNASITVPTPPGAFLVVSSSREQDTLYVIWSESRLDDLEQLKMRLFSQRTAELSRSDRAVVERILVHGTGDSYTDKQTGEKVVLGRMNPVTDSFSLGEM